MAPARSSFRERLYHASRSRGFLWKFALCTLALGVAAGYALSALQASGPEFLAERILAGAGLSLEPVDSDQPQTQKESPADDRSIALPFAREIAAPGIQFRHVILAVPAIGPYVREKDYPEIQRALRNRFNATEADIGFLYLASWEEKGREHFDKLSALAVQPQPPRYARFAAGSIEFKKKNFRRAYELFRDEGKISDAYEARYLAIQALVEAKDFTTLSELKKEPEYRRLFSYRAALREAVERRDWKEILRLVPLTQWESYTLSTLIVTLCAGIAWAFFLAHLGELPRLFSLTTGAWLFAFLLGALSTIVTVYLVILQDDIWHFSPGQDLYRNFAYHLAGVATREELCKLLFFVPLIPFLIKRDDEFESLLAASFVGLGFAIEENASYFLMSSGANAPGRFLSANFFHIGLTGLNGLALYRACTRGWGGLNELLFVLPLTIMAHGAYDALLGAQELDGSGYLAMVVYILFSMYFFRRVHELRSNVRMTISLTGSFVIGISFLAAVMLAFQMVQLGPSAGMLVMFGELLSSGILLFMFFREFNEPLTP